MFTIKSIIFLLVLITQFKITKQFFVFSLLLYAYVKTNIFDQHDQETTEWPYIIDSNSRVIQIPFAAVPQPFNSLYSESRCTIVGVSDGIHGYSCNKYFMTCQKSVAQWYHCPEGTYYDNVETKCRSPALNFCKFRSVCATLADGNYGRQCGLGYLTCKNHINDYVACSSQTVFNSATGKCEDVSEVPNCKKDIANAPTFIYFPRTDAACSKYHDGIYAFPCDPGFIICINHEQIQYTCPADTVFNPATEWCENVANVPSCQKKSPEIFSFSLPLH